jgi:hypothetical protein
MDTNIVSRMYQAARNTVKKRDFERPAGPLTRIENFLTEMIAIAIVADPQPMFDALVQAGVLDEAVVQDIEVSTQQRVFGAAAPDGRRRVVAVDLVLAFLHGSQRSELWFEIKAGAGYHGTQINDYLYALDGATSDNSVSRRLVALDYAPTSRWEPLKDQRVASMTWQGLRGAAGRSSSRLWRDLGDFIDTKVLVMKQPIRSQNRSNWSREP